MIIVSLNLEMFVLKVFYSILHFTFAFVRKTFLDCCYCAATRLVSQKNQQCGNSLEIHFGEWKPDPTPSAPSLLLDNGKVGSLYRIEIASLSLSPIIYIHVPLVSLHRVNKHQMDYQCLIIHAWLFYEKKKKENIVLAYSLPFPFPCGRTSGTTFFSCWVIWWTFRFFSPHHALSSDLFVFQKRENSTRAHLFAYLFEYNLTNCICDKGIGWIMIWLRHGVVVRTYVLRNGFVCYLLRLTFACASDATYSAYPCL